MNEEFESFLIALIILEMTLIFGTIIYLHSFDIYFSIVVSIIILIGLLFFVHLILEDLEEENV